MEIAKNIWKVVYDEQMLNFEIEMFTAWMACPSVSTNPFSLQDLGLTKISQLFMQVAFEPQTNTGDQSFQSQTFLSNIGHATLDAAHRLVDSYRLDVMKKKEQLQALQEKCQDKQRSAKTIRVVVERAQLLRKSFELDTASKKTLLSLMIKP